MFPELDRQSVDEWMRGFVDPRQVKAMPAEERALWLQEVATCIGGAGTKGITYLLSCISGADALRLRAIFLGVSFPNNRLSARKRDEIRVRLTPFLDDARALVVADAIDALRRLECREVLEQIRSLRNHRSPFVVGSVLRFLAWCAPDQAVPILEQALESSKYIVRQNAVDELDDLECVSALPRIRRLLDDPHKHVRQAALTAVRNLETAARRRSG